MQAFDEALDNSMEEAELHEAGRRRWSRIGSSIVFLCLGAIACAAFVWGSGSSTSPMSYDSPAAIEAYKPDTKHDQDMGRGRCVTSNQERPITGIKKSHEMDDIRCEYACAAWDECVAYEFCTQYNGNCAFECNLFNADAGVITGVDWTPAVKCYTLTSGWKALYEESQSARCSVNGKPVEGKLTRNVKDLHECQKLCGNSCSAFAFARSGGKCDVYENDFKEFTSPAPANRGDYCFLKFPKYINMRQNIQKPKPPRPTTTTTTKPLVAFKEPLQGRCSFKKGFNAKKKRKSAKGAERCVQMCSDEGASCTAAASIGQFLCYLYANDPSEYEGADGKAGYKCYQKA